MSIDIEALIKVEATRDDVHDRAYANALKKCFKKYNGKSTHDLIEAQYAARRAYRMEGATHYNTAACIILNELLKRPA